MTYFAGNADSSECIASLWPCVLTSSSDSESDLLFS